jgi:hypothetical protein
MGVELRREERDGGRVEKREMGVEMRGEDGRFMTVIAVPREDLLSRTKIFFPPKLHPPKVGN